MTLEESRRLGFCSFGGKVKYFVIWRAFKGCRVIALDLSLSVKRNTIVIDTYNCRGPHIEVSVTEGEMSLFVGVYITMRLAA